MRALLVRQISPYACHLNRGWLERGQYGKNKRVTLIESEPAYEVDGRLTKFQRARTLQREFTSLSFQNVDSLRPKIFVADFARLDKTIECRHLPSCFAGFSN